MRCFSILTCLVALLISRSVWSRLRRALILLCLVSCTCWQGKQPNKVQMCGPCHDNPTLHQSCFTTRNLDFPQGEETDELVMFDEDCMDMDPEDLPKRTLTEFAIYNAEVGL